MRQNSAPLLLLPGFMCDASLWDDVIPHLDPAWRPIHGDLYRDDSIDAMAERVLAEAPARFVPVGFSMGGFVAREIALRAPDRVAALGLVATSARASLPAEIARKQALRRDLEARGFRGMSRSALRRAIHPDRDDADVLVERLRAMGQRLGGEVMARQLAAERRDGHPDLPRIRCSVLVVGAREDRLRPLAEIEALAAGLPDARLTVLEDCGHMIPLERPRQLARMLDGLLPQAAPAAGTGSISDDR